MKTRIKYWLDERLWWHRLRGHKIETGFGMFGGFTYYRCADDDQHWSRSWI